MYGNADKSGLILHSMKSGNSQSSPVSFLESSFPTLHARSRKERLSKNSGNERK